MENLLNVLCREQHLSSFEIKALKCFKALTNAEKIEYDKIEIKYDYTWYSEVEVAIIAIKDFKNILTSTLGEIKFKINDYLLVLNDIASGSDIVLYKNGKEICVELYNGIATIVTRERKNGDYNLIKVEKIPTIDPEELLNYSFSLLEE